MAEALRRGDSEATNQIRERVRRIVAFRGYAIPSQEQMDLVQEVMAQLWQAVNRRGFDPGAGFWGFVETVSVRRCIDWWRLRRQTVQLDPGLEDGRRGPLAGVLARERSRQVLEILSRLPKPCRDLILMRFSLGKSYQEISQVVGKSEGALRVQLHRCLARFREFLDSGAVGENPSSSSLDSEA